MSDVSKSFDEVLRRRGAHWYWAPATLAHVRRVLQDIARQYADANVVGIGGLGIVVRARDPDSGQIVAIKITPKTEGIPVGYAAYLASLQDALPDLPENVLLPLKVIDGPEAIYEIYPFLERAVTVEDERATRGISKPQAVDIVAQVASSPW